MIRIESIPGTISPEAARIQWRRQAEATRIPHCHDCRAYLADVSDGVLKALVSHDEVRPGLLLWHLSVSFRGPNGELCRLPSWDELKHAKFQLVPADVPMILLFPRRQAPYVNVHNTTLHLFESTEEDIDL